MEKNKLNLKNEKLSPGVKDKRRKRWIKQRIKRGYSDRDVWSFDSFLAQVIAGGVRQVAQFGGYPGEFEDNPDGYKEILNFIADQFEWYAKQQFDYKEFKDNEENFHKAWVLFEENFGSLWT
jgi:hypothetical protein